MSQTNIEQPDLIERLAKRFAEFESKLNGKSNSSLHQIRRQAFDNFKNLGIPSTKHEEWKYTNVAKILKKEFDFDNPGTISANDVEDFMLPELSANILVFANGHYRADLSKIISDEKVLIIKDFAEAYQSHQELIDHHFAKYANIQEEAFTALNTAFAEHGIFIHIPDNQIVTEPIILYFIADAREHHVAIQPRNLFIAGKSSQALIIDKLDTLGDHDSLHNAVTEIAVHENAHLKHYKIQNDKAQGHYIGTTQVHQDANSIYTNAIFSLDGGLIRNNLNVALNGENIETNMYGLYMISGNTHVDNHTLADHQKPHSYSNELYKGVLNDKATGVFNGKIYVRQDAQKTNAYQQNRNILLSDNASINTKPQLEIWADDVKCSHGATTGNLDPTALFYLRSRGIPLEDARALLIQAFCFEIVEKLDEAELKTYLEALITKRLLNT